LGSLEGDGFTSPILGLHWQCWKGYDPHRFRMGDVRLIWQGRDLSLIDSPMMVVCATDHSYVVEADVKVAANCEAGLLLFNDEEHPARDLLRKAMFCDRRVTLFVK
jgi:hypothetical protein